MSFTELMISPILIGMSHSMETDHVVAVGNLVRIRQGLLEEAALGATWGLGHTLSVMAGAFFISFINRFIGFPGNLSFELFVGIMMVLIGIYRITFLLRNGEERLKSGKKILFFNVGVVHGLAGSGSIAAMLAGRVNELGGQFIFLIFFGIGTIIGMSIIAAFITRFKFLQTKYMTAFSCFLAFCSLLYGCKIIFEQIH